MREAGFVPPTVPGEGYQRVPLAVTHCFLEPSFLSARYGLSGVWMSYPVVFCAMLALQSGFYLLVWRYRSIERLV